MQDPNVKTLLREAKQCDPKDVLLNVSFGCLNIVADLNVDVFDVLRKLARTDLDTSTKHGKQLNQPVRLKFRHDLAACTYPKSTFAHGAWSTREILIEARQPTTFNIDIVVLPHLRHAVPDDFGASVGDIQALVRDYTTRADSCTMFVLNNALDWNYQPIVSFFQSSGRDYQPRGTLFIPDLTAFDRTKKVSLPIETGASDAWGSITNLDLAWRALPELKTTLAIIQNENVMDLTNTPWFKVPVMRDSADFYQHLRKAAHDFAKSSKKCTDDVTNLIDKVFDERKADFMTLASGVLRDSEVSDDYHRLLWPSVRHGMLMGFAQASVLRHINVTSAGTQAAIDALFDKCDCVV